ncbi:hypothetical protein WJX79_006584 [Trebouxia sp. C0005]
MQTHNLTPFTGAEVKSAFHDFTEHQLDVQEGVASGSQNPAAASHVTEQHAAHNVAPLTDKEVAKDTLVKTILETNSLSTEEKAQRLQAIFTLFENRPAVAPAVAALGHTQGRVAPHRGSFSPARPRNNTPYARGPTGGRGMDVNSESQRAFSGASSS